MDMCLYTHVQSERGHLPGVALEGCCGTGSGGICGGTSGLVSRRLVGVHVVQSVLQMLFTVTLNDRAYVHLE